MAKKHIFISYSRKDKPFVERLAQDLMQAGINIWLDMEDLEPGTPNWEQSIRDAINNAEALLLIASPDSRTSAYVQGELTLAKLKQLTIYPIWAVGDQWIDCVTLDMSNYQYVDCRSDNYATGLTAITRMLKKLMDMSEGIITIGLPTHEQVELNFAQFQTAHQILTHIYQNYLQDWYGELTYGSEWVLANVHTKQIAMPWEWLKFAGDDKQALYAMYERSYTLPVSGFGIRSQSHWAVWEASRIRPAGIAANSETIVRRLLSQYSMRELELLRKNDCLQLAEPQNVKPSHYKYAFVMALFGTKENRVAFIETGKNCE